MKKYLRNVLLFFLAVSIVDLLFGYVCQYMNDHSKGGGVKSRYYVCKGYFDTIPKSLDEAAIIDGATRAQILVKMIIPLSKPIIIYTALVAFMAPWCDYIFASYVAFGYENGYNVAVAMTRWVWTNDYQGYFTRFCAGGILVAIPVTILFMCLQKYYVEGVTGGAVKG